ncbi:type II toxin-antitoxin system VapC family toxin [Cuspidothrix issatschenkoi LEGE 03284]|uniref:type II toxin-antitoxin system tRNA(fMet)-specific endonuclease VapC n=1 Tax=Cuspidothrix issatschenkoi TaxID=230752 RepID=UPI00187F552A|nr:type II toxin-antitoxin system VapC family toxin [Cuspidothrix issatschenkoi]MBE9233189.1 type II toxin-antitoxin system VapC family toxin [Cuspidothrix issatschenkoi LEGE 03284]
MIYLLDTNACIVYLNRPLSNVRQRLKTIPPNDIAVCSIVKAELSYGAMRSHNPSKTLAGQEKFIRLFVSLPFDDVAANIFGRIRAELAAVGTPIGPYDLQIAAIAMANNLILVTHNVKEFSRVNGLNFEDWEV